MKSDRENAADHWFAVFERSLPEWLTPTVVERLGLDVVLKQAFLAGLDSHEPIESTNRDTVVASLEIAGSSRENKSSWEYRSAYLVDLEQARAAERARIVAWLRAQLGVGAYGLLLAEGVENQDHRKA